MHHGIIQLHRAGIARCCAPYRVAVGLINTNIDISQFSTTRSSYNYETSPSSIVNSFPVRMQPYLRLARLDRPIGSWLLFWPCAWSIGLASDPSTMMITLGTLSKFGLGSVVMRGAGCTINDLWDRDFDKQVARTVSRPLANGDITPRQAIVFLAAQLSAGLAVLLSLNQYSILLGAASLPLVILYPLTKRITFWPQAFLGATFNWGALLGYSAVRGYCDWSVCLPLYAACISWTLMYDTIYAFQDTQDDQKLGLKSTALLLGPNYAKPWLGVFACASSCGLLVAGVNAAISWPYYAGVAVVTGHMAWQITQVNLANQVDCLHKFRSNKHIGILLFLAIIGGVLLKHKPNT